MSDSNPMDDTTLSVAAGLFELGVPTCLFGLYLYRPRMRKFAAVVLGATSLPACFYVLVVICHYLAQTGTPDFAFYAMWVMTFEVYVWLLIGAVAFACIPRPAHLLARFFLGMASTPISYLLFDALYRLSQPS